MGINFDSPWTSFCAAGSRMCFSSSLILNGNMLQGTYQRSDWIETDVIVLSNTLVEFKARDFIQLNSNFEVKANATFSASKSTCN